MTMPPAWHPSKTAEGLILDLGANHGEFALPVARLNPRLDVLAIEPIPHLADAIDAQAQAERLDNLRCLRIAIDEAGGEARLNVQSSYDQGVSSLLAFDQQSVRRDEYWRERTDLAFDTTIPVSVRRLDEVLPADLGAIRFAKIDVQGRDIQALRSLGRHLDRLDGGMLEIPGTLENRLYEEEVVDLGSAIAELRRLGFEIHAIKPNDHAGNEYNLFFHRQGSDWRRMEQELGLRSIPLYSGKHFWHLPSDHLRQPEAELAELGARATAADNRLAASESQVRESEAKLTVMTETLALARQALVDALASAEALRLDNSWLRTSAAALQETIQRQEQRCVLLESEKEAARRAATAHVNGDAG